MSLADRMNFAPGVASAERPVPRGQERLYQLIQGRVFFIVPGDVTARGELSLGDLSVIAGKQSLEEGWYDHDGLFLGRDLPVALSLLAPRPAG